MFNYSKNECSFLFVIKLYCFVILSDPSDLRLRWCMEDKFEIYKSLDFLTDEHLYRFEILNNNKFRLKSNQILVA